MNSSAVLILTFMGMQAAELKFKLHWNPGYFNIDTLNLIELAFAHGTIQFMLFNDSVIQYHHYFKLDHCVC